ncbi:helicase-related protein [Bifidobacterium leontopitheci]|uniref:Type III restriction enzyme, res subunit n=1 Tax=Bifidobacterium leontopitheci TaxID=2650774 RepID=A0A6I1GL96_9BIFI|nr:helicase-related protein [Bifidobacterium leontopitheci]KAB7790157.1 type III restriction enzyme, res subunit [Bifidobacterium leontopitheci]
MDDAMDDSMDAAMLTIADIKPGVTLFGIMPGQAVTVVAAAPMGGTALDVFYTTADGGTGREIIDADTVTRLSIAQPERSGPRFDADPDEFRLAAEALRIRYAALYDPMAAVYSSDIDPLPHQIRAVYEDMLPKVPLRFLLADDPGAGKTVMAGLYVKEMLLRSAAERVAIVCPGGLAEQWRDELAQKFSLDFEVFDPAMRLASSSGNPFRDHDRLIIRMDQVARNDELMGMIGEVRWDIAIVDEAHRMSAHFKTQYGEVSRTSRFRLGETLAETAENLLLMTATPHSGNEQDFQLFMTLLDRDRFAGKYRPARHRSTDTHGLMRRMVKEDLLTFDGKPLFPERRAQTVAYELSAGEADLYRAVTNYVRSGMNAAARLLQADGRRANSIGFALTILQRRLASSLEAILRSLVRRRDRLSELLRRIQEHPESITTIFEPTGSEPIGLDDYDDRWDETDEDDQGQLELELDQVVDSATAARTEQELAAEISVLDGLVDKAKAVRMAGADAKWSQLADILQHHVLDVGTAEQPHKMIIFTEHRDTLTYLTGRVAALLGQPEAVTVIHGGMSRDERKTVQERFVSNPEVRILVATDAAGEGLNLHRADLMVNYDLPWNPNRIEQRFGRIHRIGQLRTCFLWNLVAKNTREGEVYGKLLGKIETMGKAYSGRLFNVLGDGKAFDGKPLKDLMIQAIQYGDDPRVQARLDQVIDSSVRQGLDALISERSAHPEMYPSLDVREVRELMEKTRERKLQPGYVSAFFLPAFQRLGGTARLRETNRWELTHVPAGIRRRAQQRDRHRTVADAYERITFEPGRTRIGHGSPDALLVAPGVPLLDAVAGLIIDRYGETLDRGTVFVDRTDTQPGEPTLMVAAEQTIEDARGDAVSRHFDYLQLAEQGEPAFSPAPPYLDYDAPRDDEREAVLALLDSQWLQADHTDAMRRMVYEQGTKPRLAELQTRKTAENEHVLAQVRSRLGAEIDYWYGEYNKLHDDERNGKRSKRMTPGNALKRAKEMEERLSRRERELSEDVRLRAKPATIRGMALVVPERLVAAAGSAEPVVQSRPFARRTEEVDRRAVALTMRVERLLGRTPTEMPHNNKGFDIRSVDAQGYMHFIEVKGRIDLPEADTFTVTANEVAFAQSQGDRHRLALVRVSPDGPEHDRIRYVARAFDHILPAQSTRSFNEQWANYWNQGETPSEILP